MEGPTTATDFEELQETSQQQPGYSDYPDSQAYPEFTDHEHPFELNMIMEIPDADAACPVMGVVIESPMNGTHRRMDLSRRWLLDSGATSHYVKDLHRFRTYVWLDQPIMINTGKGPVWGLARGEVEIVIAIGLVVVGGVLLVPDLDVDADLISVTALMAKGFSVTFAEGKADILKDSKV